MRRSIILSLLLAAALLLPIPTSAQTGQAAIVQTDASLKIGTELVRLAHIRIPPTGRSCDTNTSPVRCGSRAYLALAARVQGLVQCQFTRRIGPAGPRPAFCSVSCTSSPGNCREDLGAYLISEGWAVTEPGARAEYLLLEVKARQRGKGTWGSTANELRRN